MTNDVFGTILDHLCTEARNSMHAMLGFMELSADLPLDPPQLATVALGRASADQLMRSIDDARELAAEGSPAAAAVEDMDMVPFVAGMIDVLNAASGSRRRKITFESAPGSLPIRQARKDVEQVLMRILGTASKLACGTQIFVRVEEHTAGCSRIVINCRDSGLSQRLVNWLNSPLSDVNLRNPGDMPLGVSMLVAGKRLRALGGSAAVIGSSAGHSSLAVDFPGQSKSADALESAQAVAKMFSDSLNVLIAEDNDESYFLTELMLQHEEVSRARDGQEALRAVQKQRFDLVLMDVHMPGMDGYSAIRAIREWETETGNARTPLVVLSSDDLETQHRSAAVSGCSGFLRKPLHHADIKKLVDRLKQIRAYVV